jgi:uncharacterized cupredoxin-like copper-binding protein
MRRVAQLFALAAFGLAGAAAGVFVTSGSATPGVEQATSRITVTMTEFKFKLSKQRVPTGTVIFTVKNKGKIPHDFKIYGKKTKLIAPGKSATLRVTIRKKGRFGYVCTVSGHARLGMKGRLAVGVTPPTTTTVTTATTATTTVPGPATTVQVGMYEYRFELSQSTIPSGTVTFVITNNGAEPHNFDIVGVKSGAILGPGQTETWTVGLPSKQYSVVCDVPFHTDRGMVGVMNVTS